MKVRRAAAGGVAAILVAGTWWLSAKPSRIEVSPGTSVEAILRTVPEGTTVRLLPGIHQPFEIRRAVSVTGLPGTQVRGPLTVLADGVRLSNLEVTGGESGIVVREADGVEIDRVTVRGAELHGIEVAPGSATVRHCVIEGLLSPYAQGFEVRNSSGRGRTVVEGCSVSSGQEGIVSHVSRVEFRGNRVTDTSLRAIVITEMSEGLAEDNQVSDVSGVGLYCGDESHCEFRRNTVRGVAPAAASASRSHAGYGAVALYHATMRLQDNTLTDVAAAEPVGLFLSSRLTDRFPLVLWPPGWAGAVPALWVSGLSVLGLVVVRAAAGPWVRRRGRRPAAAVTGPGPDTTWAVALGLGITSFHMLEHGVQVVQVYVLQSEVHSGLLGRVVDSEWVHLAYNAGVLVFAVWLWRLVRPGGPAASVRAAPWALAALAIQGYHVAEHVAKIVQHVTFGVKVAPGILGGTAGLVWFHFGINLAVFAGLAVPMVAILRRRLRIGTALEPVPEGAAA